MPKSTTVRREIVAAALEHLGDAEFPHLLKSVTPELLADGASWSASTVRYHFGHRTRVEGAGLAFQRQELALEMLSAALVDAAEASDAAAAVYGAAAQQMLATRSLDPVLQAITANLNDFIPGASARDVAPRERMYHLAVAVADTDTEVARHLRTARQKQVDGYAETYQAFLAALGREMRPGRTVEDLANAIFALLDGHLTRLRFDPRTSADWVGEAVLALFASFTVRRGEQVRDLTEELLP